MSSKAATAQPPIGATAPRFHRILVPTDLSEHSRGALNYAAHLARIVGGELHVLHVFTMHEYEPEVAKLLLEKQEANLREIESGLEKEAGRHRGKGLEVKTATARAIAAYDAILSYADQHAIEAIVIATHGYSGLKYVLLGSVAERVVRHAKCPVLVVRNAGRDFVDAGGKVAIDRILYPTDFSPAAAAAAPTALALAREQDAELIVAHVVRFTDDVSTQDVTKSVGAHLWDKLQAEGARLFGDYPKLRLTLWEGPVARSLIRVAEGEEVDLVVMASVGRHGFKDFLLGSDAERMCRLAPCPVLIMKNSGESR